MNDWAHRHSLEGEDFERFVTIITKMDEAFQGEFRRLREQRIPTKDGS